MKKLTPKQINMIQCGLLMMQDYIKGTTKHKNSIDLLIAMGKLNTIENILELEKLSTYFASDEILKNE